MGAVNSAIIEVVESVLQSQGELDNDNLFDTLMDELLNNTARFWQSWSYVIPAKHRRLFDKYTNPSDASAILPPVVG